MGRSLLPFLLLPILAGGCSSSASRPVRPVDLFGSNGPPSRLAEHDLRLPPDAGTFALVARAETLPPELEPLVAALLERRGWSRVEPADPSALRVALTGRFAFEGETPRTPDGGSGRSQMTFNPSSSGSGDVLTRTSGDWIESGSTRGPRQRFNLLGVRLRGAEAAGPAWEVQTWIHVAAPLAASRPEIAAFDRAATPRLVAALADRLPAAPVLSAERRALDRLGADLLVVPSAGGETLPVVLSVAPGSAAERAGWRPRDVLVEVAGAPVSGAGWSAVARRLAVAESEPVRVELTRAGERYLTFLVPGPALRPVR